MHLGGLFFSLVLNLMGWYCPLTHLETYLRTLYSGQPPYGGSFIFHYLEHIVYPEWPEKAIRIGGIVFVCVNLLGYGALAKRYITKRRELKG